MKKVVILVGFVGLCLASPYSPVYEKDFNRKLDEAVLNALGADFDDEEACKGASLFGYITVKYLSYESGDIPGHIYQLDLDIKRADGMSVHCRTQMTIFDNGAIGVNLCNCK